MKTNFPFVALAAVALVLSACATGGPAASSRPTAPETVDDLPFTVLSWNSPVPGTQVQCPATGTIVAIETDEFGLSRVAIAVEQPYYWADGERVCNYELLVGGLDSVALELGPVEAGAVIGAMGETPYLAARSETLDPWLVRSTDELPQDYLGAWWFRPDWLLGRDTTFLSYRPVPSLPAHIEDFYRRWADEGETGEGFTLHYFPALDRIRAPFALDAYPVPTGGGGAKAMTELQFYRGSGAFTHESPIDLPGDYDATLYWPEGFESYLAGEYEIGQPIWLYASVITLDHINRRILVFVHDFQLADDEAVVADRLMIIREANPGALP
ncbi:MAG: hypothetical protein JXA15_01575 [Spirochaetales bacterium]|nr:hypothetical protein [Spirochaetales bacterium]